MSYEIKNLGKNDWPQSLFEIPQPPKELTYAGAIPDYSRKFLCVVGSRKYSDYGKEAATSIIMGLQGFPITIVSGLALGIDSIAHRIAMRAMLPTIAVPGSGLSPKAIHPASHISLAEEIIASGGTLISEFDRDMKATLWSFPMRNRIMAGLSHAVLLVEAEQKSGTLITAKFASEYNKELLAVPGSIFAPSAEGPNMFLRLGATLVRNSDDVLEALGIGKLDFENAPLRSEKQSSAGLKKYSNCSANELLIVEILREPIGRDELLSRSPLSVPETQTILSLLELKGLLEERLGELKLI